MSTWRAPIRCAPRSSSTGLRLGVGFPPSSSLPLLVVGQSMVLALRQHSLRRAAAALRELDAVVHPLLHRQLRRGSALFFLSFVLPRPAFWGPNCAWAGSPLSPALFPSRCSARLARSLQGATLPVAGRYDFEGSCRFCSSSTRSGKV